MTDVSMPAAPKLRPRQSPKLGEDDYFSPMIKMPISRANQQKQEQIDTEIRNCLIR